MYHSVLLSVVPEGTTKLLLQRFQSKRQEIILTLCLGKASKFRSGTRLSESDPINFRLFGIGTDLWSLIAVSDVNNTVADSIGANYILMCHHALI